MVSDGKGRIFSIIREEETDGEPLSLQENKYRNGRRGIRAVIAGASTESAGRQGGRVVP